MGETAELLRKADLALSLPRLGGMARPNGVVIVSERHWAFAGIDGEAVTLQPPVRFESRPGVLRVRIARAHPGASPSTEVPLGLGGTIGKLTRIALGRAHPAGHNT